MSEHHNAEILRGMADGRRVLARFMSKHDVLENEFTPLEGHSSSALHALVHRPSAGTKLQGEWEFMLTDEDAPEAEDCSACLGTGEGRHEGQSCAVCKGRGY